MQVIGHQRVTEFLKKSSEAGKTSHAYLFFGPDRVGKKRVALEFIKSLNCGCQDCRTCREIEEGISPDLVVVNPEKKEIRIGQIRDLSWRLSLQPHSSSYKSAIIDDAHLMNLEAQSALLKTLEEPRGKAVIVLVTAFPKLLLPTIISRTERIRFSPVAREEIEKYLVGKEVSGEKIEELLSVSLGKPGEVIDFLENPLRLKERNEKIKELERLMEAPLSARFQYAKKVSDDSGALLEILNVWLRYFRKELVSSSGKYPLAKLKKVINLIQNVSFLISKTEVNRKLALEMILLEL